MKQYAKRYAQIGWTPIPLPKDQKYPAIEWRKYQTEKPVIEQINWTEGIAIITGKPSGIIVVDVDTTDNPLNLDSTVISQTQSGGRHYFYRYTEALRNTVRLNGAPVDFRGDGGLVVVPPTQIKGKEYKWIKAPTNEALRALPELPEAVKKYLDKPFKPLELNTVINVPEGSRNDSLYKLACSLLRKNDPASAYQIMLGTNQTYSPPLAEREVRQIFESAQKFVNSSPMIKPIPVKEQAPEKAMVLNHISDFEKEARDIAENPNKMFGLATGYNQLDRFLKGLNRGELIIISADTSHGKTLFAQNLIMGAQKANPLFSTLVFTLEMPRAHFVSRLYKMDEEAGAYPIYLYDNSKGVTIEGIKEAIIRAKENTGCDLVFIDMLNSLPGTGENLTTEITRNVKAIKSIAVELNVPILLTAHTRRRQGSDSRLPSIDDLKDSSTIAQDADMVILLSRDDQDEDERYKLNVYVAKNRNKGTTGTLQMFINFNTLKIEE